jgi:hypothetical protein
MNQMVERSGLPDLRRAVLFQKSLQAVRPECAQRDSDEPDECRDAEW